jgi:hypothetical protein
VERKRMPEVASQPPQYISSLTTHKCCKCNMHIERAEAQKKKEKATQKIEQKEEENK